MVFSLWGSYNCKILVCNLLKRQECSSTTTHTHTHTLIIRRFLWSSLYYIIIIIHIASEWLGGSGDFYMMASTMATSISNYGVSRVRRSRHEWATAPPSDYRYFVRRRRRRRPCNLNVEAVACTATVIPSDWRDIFVFCCMTLPTMYVLSIFITGHIFYTHQKPKILGRLQLLRNIILNVTRVPLP